MNSIALSVSFLSVSLESCTIFKKMINICQNLLFRSQYFEINGGVNNASKLMEESILDGEVGHIVPLRIKRDALPRMLVYCFSW